jgi:cytochrome c553
MKRFIPILVLAMLAPLALQSLWAATPSQFIASYSANAAEVQPGFVADTARGKAFAGHKWGASPRLASCTACHTDNPRNPGRHVVTGKTISPLSPAVNPERFTDQAKVEKWFKRNCKEVVGRACTAAEKADYIAFATNGN